MNALFSGLAVRTLGTAIGFYLLTEVYAYVDGVFGAVSLGLAGQ